MAANVHPQRCSNAAGRHASHLACIRGRAPREDRPLVIVIGKGRTPQPRYAVALTLSLSPLFSPEMLL
jgi:hypothetical protein